MKHSNATKAGLKREKKDNKTIFMSLFILVIMLLSVAGFALMSGGGGAASGEVPDEFPLQQIEYEGQVFWYAIRNSEQFIFESIDGFEEDLVMKGLASKIKSQDVVEIYVDDNFTNSDSLFLVEKALRGIKIPFGRVDEFKCESNTLVFSDNESLSGDCMKFIASNEDAYEKANMLVYHLVK